MYLSLIFLSFIGAFLAGLFGRKLGSWGGALITTSCLLLSLLFSLFAFFEVALSGGFVYIKLATWINSETLNVDWGFMFDSLTVTMCVVVTFISSFVHLYSTEYMSHDPHLGRFMCYLSLFTFFMLILVTGDNLVQMFLGWEGIGLASYLLINFWFTRIQANKAAIKAMILNRIGDFCLIMGILLIFIYFKAVDYATLAVIVPFLKDQNINFLSFKLDLLNTVSIFLFLGAVGKSAQLGLHTWLPDAMEGERNQSIMFIKKYSKSNPIYGRSVTPAVKVFRGLMDKNALISSAIYGTLCLHTDLRVLSGYPSVVLGKYSIEKRESVCPSDGFCKTSVRTLSFIDYSDRAKYKGKRSFSSKSRESKDLRFSRKFCRKTTIDVRFEVNSWIEQNSQIVKSM